MTTSTSALDLVNDWVVKFNTAIKNNDIPAVLNLFHPEGWWRDMLNIDFDFNSIPTNELEKMLNKYGLPKIQNLTVTRPNDVVTVDQVGWTQAYLVYEDENCRGRGFLRLKPDSDGQQKAYTLFTALWEVKGFEEFVYKRRPKGTFHGQANEGRKNWLENRNEETSFSSKDPTVLIIGAGQNGLMMGARLNAVGISNLIIDKNAQIGDNWAKRYHTLVLHDPIWADHFPYVPFPPQWPIYTPKDKLAGFMKSYAEIMELNVWTSSTLDKGTTYDKNTHKWSVTVLREGHEARKMNVNFLIQATGLSGEPNIPKFAGINDFKGEIYHSSRHDGGTSWKDKKAIVVGSSNSAHDIAADFYENGADVTIVQRSWTYVMTSENGVPALMKGYYEEDGPATDDADLQLTSWPLDELAKYHRQATVEITKKDKPLLDGLTKAGFKLNPYPDGLFLKYFRDASGYYIDVGCSQLIADGKVKVKQGQEIERILPDGIRFADGDERKADIIVLATGYGSMRDTTRKIVGDEVADKLKACWGSDKQGEISGAWRNNGVPGYFLACGNLFQSRCYSRYVALQIQLIEHGLADKYHPYPDYKFQKTAKT